MMNENPKATLHAGGGDVEISLIVPCLNEEQNIPVLVEKLNMILSCYSLKGEILIVDDLSDDYTFREALIAERSYPIVRALHKGNPRGIGNAIKFGVHNARGKMGVIIMGDLVDPLHAIPDLYQKIVHEGYDLALLSRYIKPEDSQSIPFLYRFFQWWFRFFCRIFLGMQIKDITYAFRAFNIEHFKKMKIESGGFEVSPELTIKTFLTKGRIAEISGRQGRRFSGESKFLFAKSGWGYGRVLLKGIILHFTGKWVSIRKKYFTQVELLHSSGRNK
jgi:glycosyltransferase involved in cell wall biosynthesis